MSFLSNMRLSARLGAAFTLILVLMIGLSGVSIAKVRQISANLSQVNDVNSVKQRYAINFRGSVHDRAIAIRDVVLVETPADLDAALADIERLARFYAESSGPLDAMIAEPDATDEERAIVASLKETERRTLPLIEAVIAKRRAGDAEGAHAQLLAEARPEFVTWLRQINQFIDLQEARNKAVGTETVEVAGNFTWVTAVMVLLALAAGMGVAQWATLSIKPLEALTGVMGVLASGKLDVAVPHADRKDEIGDIARAVQTFKDNAIARIREETEARERQAALDAELKAKEEAFVAEQKQVVEMMAAALARLAQGDLTVRLEAPANPNYSGLVADFNDAVVNLATQLSTVETAAEQVSHAGAEITSGSQALANSASEQAGTLEHVTTRVQQFAAMTQQSAANASEARNLAASAREHTAEGAARMERLTAAVRDIQQSSTETAKIVKTIEEIAFQTNLLALNAAVEAARAGDAGRGFAVVAEEVRALALRSAEASKNTANLIERNVRSAEHGVELNGQVLQSLEQINAQVQRVADVTAAISEAAVQQAEGVTQINVSVEQMNGVTQQVAANAEESASAAAELESQARMLRDAVGTFQLDRAKRSRGGARSAPSTQRGRATRVERRPARIAEPAFASAAAVEDDSDIFSAF